MLIYLYGNKGSGKNTLLVYYSLRDDREIWSNFSLKLPNYRELTIIDLLDIPNNTLVFLDEAYGWIDSRRSMDDINIYISSIQYHSRKTYLDTFCTAVKYNSIDVRLRDDLDILIHCLPRHPYSKQDFHYLYEYKHYGTFREFCLPYESAEFYFQYFDTNEIVEHSRKARIEFNILSQNPKALLRKIKDIHQELTNIPNPITHNSLKLCLMENEIYIGYEKYLYVYLKQGFDWSK